MKCSILHLSFITTRGLEETGLVRLVQLPFCFTLIGTENRWRLTCCPASVIKLSARYVRLT